jgi:hypothetical protein
MTHIALPRSQRKMVQMYCGRNIDRGVLGTVKHNRPPPFLYLPSDSCYSWDDVGAGRRTWPRATLSSLRSICRDCADALPVFAQRSWLYRVHQYHKNMKLFHILSKFEEVKGVTSVRMLCSRIWDATSLFNDHIGYLEVQDLNVHISVTQFCLECMDHPRAQLQILADSDLGGD